MANPFLVSDNDYTGLDSSGSATPNAAVDFFTHGVSAAALSAGIGFYNTGVALANAFGAEATPLDVGQVLEDGGNFETAEYYRKHKVGVDVAGFIGGSFIPGGLAVKGLQATQRGMTVSGRLSTGFQRALLPDNRLKAVREAIKREGMDATAIVRKEKLRTIAAGFHQQALEAAAFEGAVLLTMNQSPALDSEDLGYFDSILSNLDTAATGLAFGTAVGGVLQGAANWGVLKNEKRLYDLSTGNSQLKHSTVEERLGVAEGHRALVLAQDYLDTKKFKASPEFGKLSPGDQRNWETREKTVKLTLETSLLKASGNNVDIRNTLMGLLESGKMDAAELLGGVAAFRPMYQRDVLYDVPVTAVDFLEDAEAIEFVKGFTIRANPGLKATDEELTAYAKNYIQGVSGAARGNVNVNLNNVNQAGFVKLDRALELARQDPEYWNHMATLRHETGHTLLDESRNMLSSRSPLMKRLLDKAEEQSRLARPDDWMIHDSIVYKMDTQNYVPTEREFDRYLTYLNSPNELFADAYSRLSDPALFSSSAQLLKEQPELYKFMANNKALAARYRKGKQVLDTETGELLPASFIPTAADLSPQGIRIVKDTVRWGHDDVVPLKEKFDPFTANPYRANALYSVAKDRDYNFEAVGWTDIPLLTAYKAQGNKPTAVMKDGVNILDLYPDFDSLLIHAKAELAQEMKRRSWAAVQARDIRNGTTPKGKEVKSAPDAQNIVTVHIEDYVGLEVEGARVMSAAEIGRVLDVSPQFVEKSSAIVRTFDPTQGTKSLPDGMLVPERDLPFASIREGFDPLKPKHVVVQPDRKSVVDGARIWGMAETQKMIRAQRAAIDTAVATYAGKDFDSLPQSAVESGFNLGDNVSSMDATSGLLTSANQEYFSGGSIAQQIGVILDRITKRKKTEISNTFDSLIVKLSSDESAVMEAAVLDSVIRQAPSGMEYQFAPQNVDDLLKQFREDGIEVNFEAFAGIEESGILAQILKPGEDVIWRGEVRKMLTDIARNPFYGPEEALEAVEDIFPLLKDAVHSIGNKDLAKFWRTMVKYNGDEVVQHKNSLAARIGGNSNLDSRSIYAGPADTALYPFHALVVSKQKGVLGMQDTGMIVAKDANDLQRKIADLRGQYTEDEIGIYTKKEIEAYKKAEADYVGAKLFRESNVNTALARKGVMWDVLPQPNPQLFNQYKAMLERQQERLARGMIQAKYGEELASLRQLSAYQDQFVSTVGGTRKERNIYSDTEKLMLNKRPEDSDNLWHQLNTISEKAISTAYYTLLSAGRGAVKTGDWEAMNKVLDSYGMRQVYTEANQLLLTNVDAPRPVLAPLISKMNFVVGTSMLRMDSAHALVNAVSLPIMLQSEFSALKRFASKDRWQVAMDGTSVQIPGRPEKLGASLLPLAHQAIKDFFLKPQLVKDYRARGLLNSTLEDIQSAEAEFAKIAGQIDAEGINATLEKIINTISAPSDYSEQLTKFVAARVADLFTDTLKVSDSMKWATVNTFTSRVVGNYQASQRPTLFQGWGGQAIGLFQTYQFNLLQSMFSNISHGNKMGVASMLGLQAGIFGAQSVPGFQVVNQYVGERSQGNRDFYSTARSMMGSGLGDWLMYGTASSATVPIVGVGLDLYARGDLTPRTPILLPTSLAEVPAVAIPTKVIGSILGALDKISDGAPAKQSWLEALAHSGFNRPIAGIAQLKLGQRTSTQGQTVVDLPDLEFLDPDTWDVWNMATRAMGTKPLDESIAVSAFYRTLGYRAARQDQLNSLGESYKTAIRSGVDSQEQYLGFMAAYAERGGQAENFQGWVQNNYQNATQSQIDRLRRSNTTPEGRYMQEIMGARPQGMIGDYGEDLSVPK